MSYSPLAIANDFIDRARNDGECLDHLKLQKLVYLAHGWNLAIHGEPLLDESVEAWKYGPVVSSLYHQFKHYGNEPITENGVERRGLEVHVPNIDPKDDETRALLDRVWEVYREFSGVQLSNATHQPGTPWERTWRAKSRWQTSPGIDDEMIEQHFRQLARKRRSRTSQSSEVDAEA